MSSENTNRPLRPPAGIALDANGNLFVAATNPDGSVGNDPLVEIPFNGGSYGVPITLDSSLGGPQGIAVDASGNVFVADTNNDAVKEILLMGSGSYGPPVTLH